jgi:hypothetical protein
VELIWGALQPGQGGGNLYKDVECGKNISTNTTVMVDPWITFLDRQEMDMKVMQMRQKWSSL